MNTKLFNSFAVAAMSVLALACAKEPVGGIEASTVSFTVEVPETTVTTKGISDASTTDELICQVFLNDGNYTPVPELTQKVPVDVASHKAKVEFSLVKGNKYAFIFWAQASGTGFYDTSDLRSVKMNVANVKANEPKMDAFWATETLTATADPSTKTKTLLRALAQVNFGAKIPSRSDALTVVESSVKMSNVPDTFHPFNGNKSTACDGSVEITFANNAAITNEDLTVGVENYSYIATAYVFAPKQDKKLADVETTFKLSNGSKTTVKAPNAPIQGNYRTNILGDLLTVGSTWTITIDAGFKGTDFVYDAVSASLEKGATVTLSGNYTVAAKSTGVSVSLGVTSVLNLNGKNFSNVNGATAKKAALQVHGNLTINGDGEVYCEGGATNNAIIVEQGGHLVINGGTYNVGKDANGTSNATIYVEGPDEYGRNGSVEIYGGTFNAEAGTDGTPFVLNQSDDIATACFTVYGGTFIGFNPANVNEAHGAITSFVAPGYKSVKVSDTPETWEVQDAAISVGSQDALDAAISSMSGTDDVIVKLASGSYDFQKSNFKGTIAIKGADKENTIVSVPNNGRCYDNNSISFENLTLNCQNTYISDSREAQFPRATTLYFENCKIIGCYAEINSLNTTFKNCEFVAGTDQYAIKYYGGKVNSKVVLEGCTFKTQGKCILMFNESANKYNMEVKNCSFKADVTEPKKAAIQMHTESGISGTLTISNTTATGFDTVNTNGLWWEGKNNVSPKVPTKNFTIIVDGATVQTAE